LFPMQILFTALGHFGVYERDIPNLVTNAFHPERIYNMALELTCAEVEEIFLSANYSQPEHLNSKSTESEPGFPRIENNQVSNVPGWVSSRKFEEKLKK